MTSLALGRSATAGLAIEPYERERHGNGPWRVVAAVFREYGFEFATGGYDDDLARPEAHYDGRHGWFAVALQGGEVVGCVGLTDEGGGLFELHRLYVLPPARKSGAGTALCRWVFDIARRQGASRLELFSDIHFADAHRLYRRLGFRNHRFRYAHDPWQSPEWGFILEDLDEVR